MKQHEQLRKYNRWRRGDKRLKMPDPKELGELIDRVTFAERPPRETLAALKAAGFYWSGGSWHGRRDRLPELVTE